MAPHSGSACKGSGTAEEIHCELQQLRLPTAPLHGWCLHVPPRHRPTFAWKKFLWVKRKKHKIPSSWHWEGSLPDKAVPYICFLLAVINKHFKAPNNKSDAVHKFSTAENQNVTHVLSGTAKPTAGIAQQTFRASPAQKASFSAQPPGLHLSSTQGNSLLWHHVQAGIHRTGS